MERELSWSRAQTSGAFSLALLLSGLIAIPAGRWVDKNGARGLMSLGSSLGVLMMLAWAYVDNLLIFYLIQAGIGLAMAASFYEIAFTVIAVWFRRNRRNAMLIVTLVAGLASTIFIPLTTFLIESLDWRDALKVLALLLAIGTIPFHALVLRRRPQDLGLEPDGLPAGAALSKERNLQVREALRTSTFWWLSLAFALDRITIIAIAAHSVPMLLERGYSPALVAAAAGSIGLMQLAGRIFFTPAAATISLQVLTALIFALHALSLLSLLFIPGMTSIWVFAALFGMANGASTLARASLIADIYGSAHYGSINGSMATLIAMVQTIAPLGTGFLHDGFGNYNVVLWILTIASALAALSVLQARPQGEASYAR